MDQVEQVKAKTDIVALINEYLTLTKAGRNFKALCPFHSEKTPSFMVNPELQVFKCFGCGESGDVFSFLQKHEGMDFYEALKFLADRAGIKLRPFRGRGLEKEKLYQANLLAAKLYHYLLLQRTEGRQALNYLLRDRQIKKKTLQTFLLGFAPEQPTLLTNFLVRKKKFSPKDLAQAGLVYSGKKGLIDRFRGRVIFPIFDHRGNAVALAGRVLPSAKKDLAKYINSPETRVYQKRNVLYGLNITKPQIKRQKKAIVVEGELDLISTWQAGIKNVVAIKGSALTEEQLRILSRLAEELVFALDADPAGDAAAKRGIFLADNFGFSLKVVKPSQYKDPDEYVQADPAGFQKAVAKPISIWDYFLNLSLKRHNPQTGSGKAKISQELIPILAGISNQIVQAHYAGKLARKLGVPLEAVSEEIKKQVRKTEVKRTPSQSQEIPRKKSRQQLLEERLLGLILLTDLKKVDFARLQKLLTTGLIKKITSQLENYLGNTKKKKKTFDLGDFSQKLPEELKAGFADIVLKEFDQELVDSKLKKEIDLVIQELLVLRLKAKMESLGKKISQSEKRGLKSQLVKEEKEFAQLSEKLARFKQGQFESIIGENGVSQTN